MRISTQTTDLTLTFEVARQDDECWPWVVTLRSIEPQGTGLGGATERFQFPGSLPHVVPAQDQCPRCGTVVGEQTCGTCRWYGTPECEEGSHCPTGSYENWGSKNPSGTRICDACAVEQSISIVGAEEWLSTTDPPHVFDPPITCRGEKPGAGGMVINREGVLRVTGRMVWYHWNTVSGGEEWDEEFVVLASSGPFPEESRCDQATDAWEAGKKSRKEVEP